MLNEIIFLTFSTEPVLLTCIGYPKMFDIYVLVDTIWCSLQEKKRNLSESWRTTRLSIRLKLLGLGLKVSKITPDYQYGKQ